MSTCFKISGSDLIPCEPITLESGFYTTLRFFSDFKAFAFIKEHKQRIFQVMQALSLSSDVCKTISEKIFIALQNFGDSLNQNFLIRISLNQNFVSFQKRTAYTPANKIKAILFFHQRKKPFYKSLEDLTLFDNLKKINPAEEELLICDQSYILEGATSNLICIFEKEIICPDFYCLEGITRKKIIENLQSEKKISFRKVRICELCNFQEILLIGTGKGVSRLDKIPAFRFIPQDESAFLQIKSTYQRILRESFKENYFE